MSRIAMLAGLRADAARKRRFALVLPLLCLLVVPAVSRAAAQMLFTAVGSDNGLSQGSIKALLQDNLGFMWIGTEDGLNRYDGNEFLRIVHDRADPASLPNNWIAAMSLATDGRLFIATDGSGVVWRDPNDGRFHPLELLKDDPSAENLHVRTLLIHDDLAWIGTRKAGLFRVDLTTHSTLRFSTDTSGLTRLSSDSIYQIVADARGTIWIATDRGVDSIDPQTGKVTQFGPMLAALRGSESAPRVIALYADRNSIIWAGSKDGLYRIGPEADHASLAGGDLAVNTILEDREQRLWLGTATGLVLHDRRTGEFTSFRHDPADPASLPDDNVVSLFEDRSGLLWVGTKSGRLAHWNPRSWSFGHTRLGAPNGNVTSFVEDRSGQLWIGSYGSGLTRVDRKTGATRNYLRDGAGKLLFGDSNVMALAVDQDNNVWVGTMNAGVSRIDTESGVISHLAASDRGGAGALPANGVMSLFAGSQNRIWVGTYGGGLAWINSRSLEVTRLPVVPDSTEGLSSDRATAITEDRSGIVWVGTDGGGITVVDPQADTYRQYRHNSDDPRSLSADTVYALLADERGNVWIGTRGGGLDRVIGAPFAAHPPTFQNYSEAQGLANNTVYGIEHDDRGRIWISTNAGLAVIDASDGSVRNFRRSHGLQGDEFNFGAHYRSPAGEMFFGGANGYNAFFPERLRFNETPPKVVLTEFLKFNSPAQIGGTYEALKDVALDYTDDVITLRFAALDYTAPAQNQFQYMLDGFDTGWINPGAARQVTYTNLGGGNYNFRLRAANSDGIWSTDELTLPIVVRSPPWARWWAWVLYALFAVGVMYAIWAAQQKRVLRETAYAKELEDKVAQRTAELALRNAQLEAANQRLEGASLTDPLTGLGNRRSLTQTMRDTGTAGDTYTMMVIDLDRLKPINDLNGHEAGDRVLVQIAEILRRTCRETDQIVRWGGDEFVILCKGLDLHAAAVLAERIRSSVAKQIFRIGDGSVARTSCSIGFATSPFIPGQKTQPGWQQVLTLADAALYLAKRARNDWVGWRGTVGASVYADLVEQVEQNAVELAAKGVLETVRRPAVGDDTVDKILALSGPGER
ncbi:MAG: two-component regulator propeller domain-containing protein [Steroidobacteraceae bacterium]